MAAKVLKNAANGACLTKRETDTNGSKQNRSIKVDTSSKKSNSFHEAEFIIVGLEVNMRVHDFVHKYNRKVTFVYPFEPEFFFGNRFFQSNAVLLFPTSSAEYQDLWIYY